MKLFKRTSLLVSIITCARSSWVICMHHSRNSMALLWSISGNKWNPNKLIFIKCLGCCFAIVMVGGQYLNTIKNQIIFFFTRNLLECLSNVVQNIYKVTLQFFIMSCLTFQLCWPVWYVKCGMQSEFSGEEKQETFKAKSGSFVKINVYLFAVFLLQKCGNCGRFETSHWTHYHYKLKSLKGRFNKM
jgi:hypothetical protein